MQTNLQRPQRLFVQPVRHEIPPFQRRYVWKQDEQWEPLWEDIEILAQSLVDGEVPDAHFMGAIVLQQVEFAAGTIEQRIVVDGQQRLTTLQLLIDAIHRVLDGRGHADAAKRLSALVANGKEYRNGSSNHAFKVWPTVVDREAFKQVMMSDERPRPTSRIAQAHTYFKDRASQWLERFTEETEESKGANALDEAVRTKLEIVVIDLGGSDDPHIIFETLNARGTPLLQSDMVKNKILHDTEISVTEDDGDAATVASDIWPFVDDWWSSEIGRGLQRRPRIDVYLNHWLTLRNQAETKPYHEFGIFENYAKAKRGPNDDTEEVVRSIAADLGKLGKIYRNVEEGEEEDVATFVARRNVMGVGVVTPLLLWLLDANLPKNQLKSCLIALESFLVRRVVCGLSARSYGELFVALLSKLAQDSTRQPARVLVAHLNEQTSQAALWPDDSALHDRFMTAPLYQWLTRGRLRMVLEGVEEALRSGKKAESGEVPRNLHIEHVMPQAWHTNWPLPDDLSNREEAIVKRDRAIHTIGNLTLVTGSLNATLSNAPWDRKKETLADYSVLYLNKRLVNKGPDVWDENAIEKRGKWLHKRALKIWPHGDSVDV